MKKKRIVIIVVILLIWVGAIGFFILKSKQKEVKTDQNVKRYAIPEEKKTFLNGTVQPTKSKAFYKDSSKVNNYTINVKDGDTVNEGSLLITYKNEEISSQIENLKDQISELKKEKNKSSNQNQPAENQVGLAETVEGQIKKAERELKKLEKTEYHREYAPFAGKVVVSSKELNSENQVLLKLSSTDLYVKSQVSERQLDKVKKDQPVEVLVLANDKKVNGKITEVSNEPEGQGAQMGENGGKSAPVANYPITIGLDSTDSVVNGYHVQAKLKSSSEKIKIPTSAIKSEDNKEYVYLIKENKLVKQFVKTEGAQGNLTTIASGLKEKDEIVEVVNSDMKEGQKVE